MKQIFTVAALAALTLMSSCGSSTQPAESKAKLAVWNLGNIDSKAEKITAGQSDATYELLKSQADSILSVETNPSVMTKPEPGVSGDMHDYVSLARYRWPDPKQPDGLPYITRDGESNPELNLYDRNRLGEMCESVNILSLVYYISGEQKYADKAVSRLRTWFTEPATRMNPNLNYSQICKGRDKGRGSKSGLIDTYSFVEMLDGIELIKSKGALPQGVADSMQTWFAELSEWMLTSENGIGERNSTNNHSIAYDAQVVRYAMYGGRDSLARSIVNDFPAVRLDKQIEADGSQPRELQRKIAYHYVVYNLEHIIDLCGMAKVMDIDLYAASNKAAERAIDWMIPYSVDQSTFKYEQIQNWDGTRENFSRLLYRTSYFGKSQEYRDYYAKNKAKVEIPLFDLIYVQ